ncbi:hypothetical protein [Legionella waltersii]|uniref:Uncharacterized protein n=1 Tax=Legionella waltersii TaxID=66969 RepID=A0A0W1ABR9_9GAMM|nr:hypothetical protein [Legionella waltersii]KTD78814.1 hypothetical protein Lwal_1584 [Legionella waltersii]SNV11006.1 Uncharacterised protein [Legionella waltersii]
MTQAKVTFWAEKPAEEYFVVKQKKGSEAISPINALHDHLSNAIYQLFGVCTPDFYIGNYNKKLSLISNIMRGYQDLVEWLKGGEAAIEEINKCQKVDDCVTAYIKAENGLSVIDKESLLAAAIVLEDTDVLGAGLRNIGLIKFFGKHKIVKIDPSSTVFDTTKENIETALKEFESNLSLSDPLIYKPFSFNRVYNNPKSVLGNLHFSEFFHDINKGKLVKELTKFANLDEKSIRNLVLRDEYFDLLSVDKKDPYLEQITYILLRKKDILRKVLNCPEITFTPPAPPQVFIKDLELGEPIEQIKHGASMPLKVKGTKSPSYLEESKSQETLYTT